MVAQIIEFIIMQWPALGGVLGSVPEFSDLSGRAGCVI